MLMALSGAAGGLLAVALASPVFSTPVPQEGDVEGKRDPSRIGHSAHGPAFDEGPRQKPWRMEGIGRSHFPITTSVPEVQEWFDQGNTLLHSFWFLEAERAFRWCLKLDPECAMAYWGLARSTGRGWTFTERAEEFLKEAVRRKEKVTERERMYIEAWQKAYVPALSGALEVLQRSEEESEGRFEVLAEEIEKIALAHPDDVEAKALHVLYSLYRSSRLGNDGVLRQVLAAAPDHPGAHHYRIHNWDGPDGAQALDSCERYGRVAWKVGHANHMPGHIYSGIGMWHEGAIWMDSATRAERAYMKERMILPFQDWNYAHNRNYLSYIQEQLGMADAALEGARQLIAAPLDPDYNDPDGGRDSVREEGMEALLRGLVKFERWDEILAEGTIPWRDHPRDDVWRAYARALAHLGRGELADAIDRMIELSDLGKGAKGSAKRFHARMLEEVGALIAVARGEELEGIERLTRAAEKQREGFHRENDPPTYPRFLYDVLGELYLERGSPGLAAAAFEKALETVKNDGFALSGMVRSRAAIGEREEAARYFGRLLFVWSSADQGLRWMEAARATGIPAEPSDESPAAQRNYGTEVLADRGPERWESYDAPELDALDSRGERVTLEEYRGRNVVLVFFLGEECPHCVDHLAALGKRSGEFAGVDADLLAISRDTPEENAVSLRMGELPFRLLSDVGFANARRFHSYDDFEEMELHSTILIDRRGRVRWARTGGDPFMDVDFLLEELRDLGPEPVPGESAAVEATASTER